MQKNLQITIFFFLIFVFITTNASAQTNIFFTSYLIQDNNAFQTKTAYKEWINNSTLHFGHWFTGKTYKIQGYYSADFLFFANNDELNNYAHKIGVTGFLDKENYTLNFSSYVRLRNYQEQFIYYNVNRYNFDINLTYIPDIKNNYILGFSFNQDRYEEFEDLDNLAYRMYGKYQRFFQSRLSITGEVGLGLKKYVNQSVIEYFGFGMGRNPFSRYREDPVRAAIFSVSANIGKSITSSTGVSLGMGGQWFIGDPIMSYTNGIYYYTENDLYDDPYSYQDLYVTLQLTKQFAIGFQGKLGFKYQIKDYAGTPALDDNGDLTGETRQDIRNEYFFMISKNFKTGWRFPESIGVFLNFMYRNNPSNDPYYDFEDHIGLIGFSVGL